jgi:hypothetical protein
MLTPAVSEIDFSHDFLEHMDAPKATIHQHSNRNGRSSNNSLT